MSANQRFDFRTKLNELAQSQAKKAIAQLGMSLPASIVAVTGQVATVKFEITTIADGYVLPPVTIPIMGSSYVQQPFQLGDTGFVMPVDASIFTVAGMTQGAANLHALPNMSSLVFFPVGNRLWPAVDPLSLVLTGIDDVLLRDKTHQLSLEADNVAWTSLITKINALLIVIGPLLTTPTVLTPIPTTTNPIVPRV